MTGGAGPAGWYPDPDGSGGQRYFDGGNWTVHRAPPPPPAFPPYGWRPPTPWKGAFIGRPPAGPGALADPGRRLAARVLDALVLLPILAGLVTLAVVLVLPHAGPIFPDVSNNPDASTPTPGFVWIELAVGGAFAATGVIMIAYETVATKRYGRTFGKAWMRIRPVRLDGGGLGWARSFGRVSVYWLAGLFNWIGALDPLWCLWDENRQCLHDKVVDAIVINDLDPTAVAGASASEPVQTPPPGWPPGYQSQGLTMAGYGPPGTTPGGLPQYGWMPYGAWAPMPFARKTNGLAIASLACSIVGLPFIAVPSILGVIFGFVSRSQIRRSGGYQSGDGLALAGIIVGFAVIALWFAVFITSAMTTPSNS